MDDEFLRLCRAASTRLRIWPLPMVQGREIEPVCSIQDKSRRETRWIVVTAVLALLAWVAFAGKDLCWDLINHHLYLPFSLLHGRFLGDLYGAGPQSYQFPLGYLPFYTLFWTLPGWAVGGALTLVHALAIWPLLAICREIWGEDTRHRFWRVNALLLALLAPTFLLVAGTSSADPLAAVLVLAALAQVLSQRQSKKAQVAAGAAIGLAIAIKIVNGVFAVAIAVVLLLRLALGQSRFADIFRFVAAAALAWSLTGGLWAGWLWWKFGNPMLPMFNHLFQSPFAPLDAIFDGRFLAEGLVDYFWRIFEFADVRSFLYTEAIAPDLRPAILAVLAFAISIVWLAKSRRIPSGDSFRLPGAQLAIFAVISYLVWMLISANGRYALSLFLVIGILTVRALQNLLPHQTARIAVGLAIVGQALHYALAGEHRYNAADWGSGSYLKVSVPKRMVEEPFLHLSMGNQSYAGIASFLHPDGALVNIVGQMSLPEDGFVGEELRRRLIAWDGRVRLLILGPTTEEGRQDPRKRATADRIVYRFGLRFNWDDCEIITIFLDPDSVVALGAERRFASLMSCAALPRTVRDLAYENELEIVKKALSEVERRCPSVFRPRASVIDGDLGIWQQRYMNDIRVTISFRDGVSVSYFRSLRVGWLGMPEELARGGGRDPCEAWRWVMGKS